MVQEYGKYYGLMTGIFRGGCLTGPNHSGVELHGFLNYLVKAAVRDREYTVYGYKGKQVRDNIHSEDVIAAFEAFRMSPRPGEVYNMGGGRNNSISILECFEMLKDRLGNSVRWGYCEKNRAGDRICYISDLAKLRTHFPGWNVKKSLANIIDEMVDSELRKIHFEKRSVSEN
jgi:CDP-paratose 2-epimerase